MIRSRREWVVTLKRRRLCRVVIPMSLILEPRYLVSESMEGRRSIPHQKSSARGMGRKSKSLSPMRDETEHISSDENDYGKIP